jgi:hypothetical protein
MHNLAHTPSAQVRPRNRWEQWAVTVWTGLLLVTCIRALGWPYAHSVYPIFAGAARSWQAGAGLYGVAGNVDVFRYSPVVAVSFVPLAQLPDSLGGVLWRLLSAAAYLGALYWWSRAALPEHLSRTQRALLLLLVLPMSLGSLNNGQSNVLVMGLLLAGMAAVAEERWNLAAGAVTLATLFKVYPVAVGLLLALLYPRRFAGRLAVGLGVGLALPFAVQEPGYVAEQYRAWLHHLTENDHRRSWPREMHYRDVRLLDWLWGGPVDTGEYRAVQLGVAAMIAALCLAGRRRGWSRRYLLTALLGLACCWMTVFGPATEFCTYLLLAPSLAWALLEAWAEGRSAPERGLLLVSFGLFLSVHLSGLFPGKTAYRNLGPEVVGGLLLFAYLVATALRPPALLQYQGRDRPAVGSAPGPC